ncbi:MAG: DUF4249 domain-containing protein [Prolixibacteraceae bacterium]|nr:DUF4249 domain-containing protein [Prolixibacteraceae bacterium]
MEIMKNTGKKSNLPGIFIQYIAIMLLFNSCYRETVLDIELLNKQPKLVLNGVLTPGDSIKVVLTRTFSVKETIRVDDGVIENADLSIADLNTGETVPLRAIGSKKMVYGQSQDSIRILPGHTYKIEANADGYDGIAAKTTIPDERTCWSEKYITNSNINYGNTERDYYKFVGEWKSLTGDDYYIVSKNSKYNRYDGKTDINSYHYINYQKSGEIYKIEFEPIFLSSSTYKEAYSVLLLTTDENLYQYIKNYDIMDARADEDDYTSFDSFIDGFRGILPEHSNVNGGLGVLGSYLKDTAVIVLNNEIVIDKK